jgi:hypothetical protein
LVFAAEGSEGDNSGIPAHSINNVFAQLKQGKINSRVVMKMAR